MQLQKYAKVPWEWSIYRATPLEFEAAYLTLKQLLDDEEEATKDRAGG